MKKMTAGQGPAPSAGVKSEAGQSPSRVLMVASRRGIGAFPFISDRQSQVRIASQSIAAEVTVACLGKTRLRSISCTSRSGSAQQSPATKIR